MARARTPKFLCTLQDYENALYSFPGVLDAKCIDMSVSEAEDLLPYQVVGYVLTDNNASMSSELKNELTNYIRSKQDITRSIIIKDAIIKELVFDINFTVTNENINLIDLEKDIIAFLEPYYNNKSFARIISKNHLISSILTNFPMIKTLTINNPSEDIYPSIGEVIDITDILVRGDYYRQL